MNAEWMDQAACADVEPEIFFPTHRNDSAAEAKKICRNCPVRFDCGLFAHDARIEFGVWGGSTEQERLGPLRIRDGKSEAAFDAAARRRKRGAA